MSKFKDIKLQLVDVEFGSPLLALILQLEHLRKKKFSGSTPPQIYYELKQIFHQLESLASLRLEGNKTTLADYIDVKVERDSKDKTESIREIENNEEALDFIDKNINERKIDNEFIKELHKIVVKNLTPYPGEGSKTPGEYRKGSVAIKGSSLVPPHHLQIQEYMDELFDFINRKDQPQYDLLKVAIAHHRFTWIHPFDNGNGRTVRLLTYAMLIKQGFSMDEAGRIINPAAVFCADRDRYNQGLANADSGEKKKLLAWCEYVLKGLEVEIEKIDRLMDYKYLEDNILMPAIDFSLEKKAITPEEAQVLRIGISKTVFQASDIASVLQKKATVSYFLRSLKERNLIQPAQRYGVQYERKYIVKFHNNDLLRGVIRMLDKEGFIPIKD